MRQNHIAAYWNIVFATARQTVGSFWTVNAISALLLAPAIGYSAAWIIADKYWWRLPLLLSFLLSILTAFLLLTSIALVLAVIFIPPAIHHQQAEQLGQIQNEANARV